MTGPICRSRVSAGAASWPRFRFHFHHCLLPARASHQNESSVAMARLRLGYTKSRGGCLRCKQRRVKVSGCGVP